MSDQPYFQLLLAGLFALLLASWLGAQTPGAAPVPETPGKSPAAAEARTPGSIKGRVVDAEDRPVANVLVSAFPIGQRGAGRFGGAGLGQTAQVMTDEEGNFQLNGLLPASYSIQSAAPGYVALLPEDESGSALWHVGEFAVVRLVKGGVITGRVLNVAGEPLTGINVNAIRVGDVEGEDDLVAVAGGFGRQWRTDDRGVYRIYGLVPGSYVVRAAGRNDAGPNVPSAYSGDAPTYYPSSAREAAVPVAVRAGEEVTGIDVQYRGEKGRTVSGRVVAQAGDESGRFGGVQITLSPVGTSMAIASGFQMGRGRGGNSGGFALVGIPDGEYELVARRTGGGADGDAVSAPRRVSVRGADVGGIELTLSPLASLSGKVVIEKRAAALSAAGSPPPTLSCPNPRRSRVEEVLLTAEREGTMRPASMAERMRPTAPNLAGEFTLRNLEAGRWRVHPQLPDENWYVQAISLDAPPAKPVRKTAAGSGAPAIPALNVAASGVNLKIGERLGGLIVSVAEGAAGVKGRVVLEGKPAGKKLIHLIPVEKEGADNLLRYAQTVSSKDGHFTFKHLSPGRYYLLPALGAAESSGRLSAWDNAKRAALRRAAEAEGTVVELAPCQRLTDYELSSKRGH